MQGGVQMNIFENPFYILGATPLDSRRKINEFADDKSLLLNTAEITEARDILINPSKRLAAEIRWFPGLSKEQTSEILVSLLIYRQEIERKSQTFLNGIL